MLGIRRQMSERDQLDMELLLAPAAHILAQRNAHLNPLNRPQLADTTRHPQQNPSPPTTRAPLERPTPPIASRSRSKAARIEGSRAPPSLPPSPHVTEL